MKVAELADFNSWPPRFLDLEGEPRSIEDQMEETRDAAIVRRVTAAAMKISVDAVHAHKIVNVPRKNPQLLYRRLANYFQ